MRLPLPLLRSRRPAGKRRAERPRLEAVERRLLLASDVFLVDTAADDGPGSLRWAIGQVNAGTSAEPGTIRFAIPGDGPATIRPLSPLDPIARPVFVEARAADGSPTVRLDGSVAGSGANGLVVTGGGSVVAGLIVTGFSGAGIVLGGAGGDFVESCYVGLVPGAGGLAPATAPNGIGVLIAAASGQTIGGPDGRGNVIAGNRGEGVLIASATPGDSADDAVVGNWIGTDAAGASGLGNGRDGVVFSGATQGRIKDNVISGNLGGGIVLKDRAAGNLVVGNVVGLAPDGLTPLENCRDGVLVDGAPENAIGGPGPALANRISANGGSGIRARGGSTGLTIQGNWIGVDPTETVRLGNQGDGVSLASDGVMVGGPDAADGNVIAFNGLGTTGAGVQFIGAVRHDSILSNRIYGNAGLGINLGNGPTPTHAPPDAPPDRAVGPNDWVNYPILTTAFADGVLVEATGRVTGMPGRSYTVQFFWTRTPDPSGFGEAERYLGQTVVTTDGAGATTFALPMGSDALGGFLTATSTDESGNTSEFALTVLLLPRTDLHVELTADPPSGPQGSPVTFTATVANRGYLAAPTTALALALPWGSTVQSITAGPGLATTGSGGSVRLDVGSLLPGASAVLTVVATAPAGFSGAFGAVAAATMGLTDARPGDETAQASSVQTPAVDLALTLDGPSAAHRGDVLKYFLTASNAGPAPASGVRLAFPIPAGASFVAATTPVGSARVEGGTVIVDVGVLAPGTAARVEIDLHADAVGLLASVATLSSANYDRDPTNQSAAVATTVAGRADLSVAMAAPTVIAVGRELAYEVTVRNAGPDDARDVVLLDLIPDGSEFVSASIDDGATSIDGRVVAATLDSLAPGASATLRLVVRPTAAAGAILRNAARATNDEEDGNPADDAAWRDTVVRDLSDLGVTASPEAATVLAGRDATFRIRVRNDGPATEPDAVLAVALPAGAQLASATSGRGGPASTAGGLAVFRLGALAAGDEVEATVVLTSSAPGSLGITAVVGGLNIDENPSDRRATAVATVVPTADLATYVDPPAAVYERAAFQYTLTAANLSPTATTGVRLAAPLPAGVEFVSAVASQGAEPTFDGRTVSAALGTLGGSSTATITITVRPVAPSGSVLLLSGVSTSDLADPSPGNDRGGYAVRVAPAVDLMLRLRPLQAGVELGGDVTWVAEVWNSSTTTATGVAIAIPYEPCGGFVGSATTQGTVTAADGVLNAAVGTLAPGAYATIAFVLRPDVVGTATLVASARADQHVNLTASGTLSADLTVIEPPGVLAFASADFAAPETAGTAYLTVARTGGARGVVSVRYRTTSGAAAAGVDYAATSGVLTFQPGQTSAVIAVPVLPFAHNRGDVSVGVVLEDPTGGARLGPAATASLTIRDVDPDLVPPTVGRVRLLGPSNAIGGLAIPLSEPANSATAWNAWAYSVYDLGPNGVYGDGDDAPVALLPPGYDAANPTIYLTPAAPLAAGRHYAVVIRGAGPNALVDLAGNPLGGGVDFIGLFARGTALKYADANGDSVSLSLKSGGFLDLVRAASGDATSLTLQGIVPGRSTLSGSVARQRGRGDGATPLGAIEGLGSFGDVRVSLRTPPFLVAGLPSPPGRTGRVPATSPRVALPARRLPRAR
ncbi:MAG: hypothetical protein BGO49_14400 [Planctomycetales bacterium 71-10]|nr:MAG: hypothetical protein BGO49_14400 [Planctomycetales bacterium 71-10]